MSFLVALILFYHLTCIVHADVTYVNTRHLRDIPPQNEVKKAEDEEHKKDNAITLNVKSKDKLEAPAPQPEQKPPESPDVKPKSTTHAPEKDATKTPERKILRPTEMESGALLRGVAVVVALTVIVIIYLGLKTYCSKRNKPVMVRKYGVRTRRSDIEMTPLPLDEDDDDETLFEVSNTNR